jgi:hypothetical protein
MPRLIHFLRQSILPAIAFAAALALHFVWQGLFSEQDPVQAQWALLPDQTSWLSEYIKSEEYWFGYSYALCFAFIASSVQNFRKSQCATSRNAAIGGATFSGFLAFAGCFLIGCCGSPMLVVWLNLFGASFLPFAKPLIALITTITIAGMWVWMIYKKKKNPDDCSCGC